MDKDYVIVSVKETVFSKKFGDSDVNITLKNMTISGTKDVVRDILEYMAVNLDT